jgi:nucleotide-binding universal stress UspA family protein
MEYVPRVYIQSQKQFDELLEVQSDKGKKILNKCLLQAKEAGVRIKTQLQEGDPASVILNESSAGKYDLIIMGSRGLGRFKRLLLGSVSTKVVHHASCSILVVRE